jgi:uncharacterized membrane protein YeaQ/YmgE (transglycosylase-associated protein family)
MDFLVWIVVGAIAGWLANSIMKSNPSGSWVMNIVIGVLGGIIGGWVFGWIGGRGITGLNIGSVSTAFIGALILLIGLRLIRRSRTEN